MSSSVIQISGQLTQSPPGVTGTTIGAGLGQGGVPQSVSQEPLALSPPVKQSAVCTGLRHKSLNSSGSFQTLTGLGTSDDVTTADTIYLKSDAPIQVQVTQQNPAGGSPIVSVLNIIGTYLQEFPAGGYATGITAQGIANLSVLFSGPQ